MNSEPDVAIAAKKRTLELEAFSSLVDALRAAGPLTPERKAVLQQSASALKISADRYKAEIRRALAKPNLSGEIDETSWAMEGRRDTFLLPRKPPRATLPAPYAAYTTRLTPALVQLPKAPYKTAETQTVAPKVAANPKLVVVSSPRSQTTHTMVYAKPGGQQRQVRVCSPQAGTPQLPVVVNTKGQQQQQQTKMVTIPTIVRPTGPVIPASINAIAGSLSSNNGCSNSSSSCGVSSATAKTLQQAVVTSAGHQPVQQQQSQQEIQQCKQIVITTPTNAQAQQPKVDTVSVRSSGSQQNIGLQTVQVRPSTGTPVVTKVLHPNRTTELKLLQKPRLTQLRTTTNSIALATMTPAGVRLTSTMANLSNGGNKAHIHSTSAAGGSNETVQTVTTIKPPAKVIKSLSQWNYDDHSVMAKPAVVAPTGPPTSTISLPATSCSAATTTSSYAQHHQQSQQYVYPQNVQHHPTATTKIQLTAAGTSSQTRTVQIVQMSMTNAQSPTTPPRVPKSVRLSTPPQVDGTPSSHNTTSLHNSNNNGNSCSYNNNNTNSNSTQNNNNNNTGSNHNNNNCTSNTSVGSTQGHVQGRSQQSGQTTSTSTVGATTVTSTTVVSAPTGAAATSQQARISRDPTVAVNSSAKTLNSNVVVQSLPYQDYQGSIYKMVPEDVIMEEEVA